MKHIYIFILASMVLSSCNDDDVDPYSQERQDCVDYINELRASIGLPSYERWEDGEACADEQARKDSIAGYGHASFGDCGEWAQNECPGWGSMESTMPGCLDSMWAEGPGDNFDEHGHYII